MTPSKTNLLDGFEISDGVFVWCDEPFDKAVVVITDKGLPENPHDIFKLVEELEEELTYYTGFLYADIIEDVMIVRDGGEGIEALIERMKEEERKDNPR